jgi:flagellar biogenesis protein FliO
MNYPHQCDHFFFFSTMFLVIAMILYVVLHLWYHIVVFLHSIVGS